MEIKNTFNSDTPLGYDPFPFRWFFFLGCCLPSIWSLAQPNDLKEYGLKGPVKKITSWHYVDQVNDGDFIENILALPFQSKVVWYYNHLGWIDSTIHYSSLFPNPTSHSRVVFYLENGRKNRGTYFNVHGRPSEFYQFNWIDPFTYVLSIRDSLNHLLVESTSWLNENFRDSKGEYFIREKDSVVVHECYENVLDDNNRITLVHFTPLNSLVPYATQFVYRNVDHHGNPTLIIQYDVSTGEVKNIIRREFEYFN